MLTTIARTIGTTVTAIIKQYLNDLGTLANSIERSTLANICEEQALCVDELFEYHISCELIAHYFKAKEVKRALANHREDFGTVTRSLFEVTEAFEGLQSPQFEIGYVPVHFPDAFQHMANVLTCDKLLRPKSFNLAFIQSEIAEFLRNY